MKPYFALSLLAVMCCNVGAVETQQTVVPHSADPILVTDGPQQDAALMNKAGLPPQPAEQPPAPAVQPPETTQAAPPSASTAAAPQASSQTDPAPATTPGSDELPPPSPLYSAAQKQVAPLTPDEVRQLRGQKENINRALASPAMTVVPRISAQTVNLSPGSSLPLVRTAVNHPSNLSFTDATGAPWPVAGKPTNPMTKDFDVYYIPDSPIVTIVAKRPYASGSITVLLKGLSVPISVEVTSGDTDSQSRVWTVDNRLDLRIPQRGPSARPMAAPESKIGLYDNTLQAFLDGTPPREAHRLKATGQVPGTTVWQLGDDLFIRTRAEIVDEFDQTLSSADGMHLFKLPVTPYVTFSVMGRSQALNITLE